MLCSIFKSKDHIAKSTEKLKYFSMIVAMQMQKENHVKEMKV